jgi:4-hydroxybenzoate polyprenyltransferase
LAILVYEHSIVRPSDLSRVNVAFFNLNGYVSLVYFAATLAEVLAS